MSRIRRITAQLVGNLQSSVHLPTLAAARFWKLVFMEETFVDTSGKAFHERDWTYNPVRNVNLLTPVQLMTVT